MRTSAAQEEALSVQCTLARWNMRLSWPMFSYEMKKKMGYSKVYAFFFIASLFSGSQYA